jgi:alanine racemase
MTSADPDRWAWAEIDLSALDHNIGVLRAAVAPAALWAVVKADGYGHGAVAISEQALRSGAAGLCVALAGEGIALRRAGIEAPILVLSQQPRQALPAMLSERLMATVYTDEHLADLAAVATDSGGTFDVHVKVDTGMHRVGVAPDAATALIRRANATSGVRLGGVFTHLACADEPESVANAEQLGRFEQVLQQLAAAGVEPSLVHAANSAGGLALVKARFDLVRAGIAIYGISPGPGVDHLAAALRPVMSLTARIGQVKHVAAGEHVSYGWRHRFESDTVIATVPIGYADGVPRRLSDGGEVLIGGRRRRLAGTITMDQLMVDCGRDDITVGDEVVLLGRQGDEEITVAEWAERLDTIVYEITCGLSPRVPRVYVNPHT